MVLSALFVFSSGPVLSATSVFRAVLKAPPGPISSTLASNLASIIATAAHYIHLRSTAPFLCQTVPPYSTLLKGLSEHSPSTPSPSSQPQTRRPRTPAHPQTGFHRCPSRVDQCFAVPVAQIRRQRLERYFFSGRAASPAVAELGVSAALTFCRADGSPDMFDEC
jgi:hypothetical protein